MNFSEQEIPVPLYTIRRAAAELSRRVSLAPRTQLGGFKISETIYNAFYHWFRP